MAWAGTTFIFVQLLQSVLGFSPLRAGIGLTPVALLTAVGGLASASLAARIGRRTAIVLDLTLQGIGAAVFLTYQLSGGYWTAITFLMIFTVGHPLVLPQCVASAMDSVPRERAGVASGATNTLRSAGVAFGVAIAGSIMSSSYRSHLSSIGGKSGLPGDLLGKAGRSIAAAISTSERTGGTVGAQLSNAARDAFEPALHTAMLSCVIMCALGIVVAAVWIPEMTSHADAGHGVAEALH